MGFRGEVKDFSQKGTALCEHVVGVLDHKTRRKTQTCLYWLRVFDFKTKVWRRGPYRFLDFMQTWGLKPLTFAPADFGPD